MSYAAHTNEFTPALEELPDRFDPEGRTVGEIIDYVLQADAIIDVECVGLLETAKARLDHPDVLI